LVLDMMVQFTRFTAAEISPRAFKARAISYVVAGGALAAVVGPERLMAGLVVVARSFRALLGRRIDTASPA
jgi:hypothetical protein